MKKTKYVMFAMVGFLLSAIYMPGAIFQESAYAEDGNVDYSLTISPTAQSFDVLEPGKTYSDSFKVKNTGSESFEFGISFNPYNVTDENYSKDYETRTKYNDIIDWLSVDVEEGTVNPGGETKITYSFTVPENTHGGAQLGTIIITMNNIQENQAEGIQTVRRLGYKVFGNVNGETIETGKVLENKVAGFLFNPPIFGSSLVENTGNIYTRATYKLQVFPLFSDEEVYTNEENPETSIILPETKRYNEIKWEGSPQLGIFKVRQTVKIFEDESVTEKIVFLCPIWFIFICLVVLFIILFSIINHLRSSKRL